MGKVGSEDDDRGMQEAIESMAHWPMPRLASYNKIKDRTVSESCPG